MGFLTRNILSYPKNKTYSQDMDQYGHFIYRSGYIMIKKFPDNKKKKVCMICMNVYLR